MITPNSKTRSFCAAISDEKLIVIIVIGGS